MYSQPFFVWCLVHIRTTPIQRKITQYYSCCQNCQTLTQWECTFFAVLLSRNALNQQFFFSAHIVTTKTSVWGVNNKQIFFKHHNCLILKFNFDQMGQTAGTPTPESIIDSTVDTIHYEIRKHAQSLKEINSLTYEEFNSCLSNLNDLWVECLDWHYILHTFFSVAEFYSWTFFLSNRSRKCLDSNGKVTIFAVKKGSDQSFLWKATVRIACVKCDPSTNRIENYKLITLREFLKVFGTFQTHLEAMSSCEEQHDRVSHWIVFWSSFASTNMMI